MINYFDYEKYNDIIVINNPLVLNVMSSYPDEISYDKFKSTLEKLIDSLGHEGKDYVDDLPFIYPNTHTPEVQANLVKFAGQLCYQSFGEKRSRSTDIEKYLNNILQSGHGSVLEHVSYTFFIAGISRSLSHELVRHRHLSFSQVSQRYVDTANRFVTPPDMNSHDLVTFFKNYCQTCYAMYSYIEAESSINLSTNDGLSKTDRVKKSRQLARCVLPNATETMMVVSGNVRSWRQFLELRGSRHADTEINRLALEIFNQHFIGTPMFQDAEIVNNEIIFSNRRV